MHRVGANGFVHALSGALMGATLAFAHLLMARPKELKGLPWIMAYQLPGSSARHSRKHGAVSFTIDYLLVSLSPSADR